MPTQAENLAFVKRLLRGGWVLSEAARTRAIVQLSAEQRSVLREIAAGSRAADHPKLRLHAVAALGDDQSDPDGARALLGGLIASSEPARLRIRALRALDRLGVASLGDSVRALVTDPTVRPDVALAAARTAAAIGGREVAAEIRSLHDRLLPLAPHAESPSLQSLRELIRIAEKGGGKKRGRGDSSPEV